MTEADGGGAAITRTPAVPAAPGPARPRPRRDRYCSSALPPVTLASSSACHNLPARWRHGSPHGCRPVAATTDLRPFAWTRHADEILATPAAYRSRINDSGYQRDLCVHGRPLCRQGDAQSRFTRSWRRCFPLPHCQRGCCSPRSMLTAYSPAGGRACRRGRWGRPGENTHKSRDPCPVSVLSGPGEWLKR
jgi:hypothetical protein